MKSFVTVLLLSYALQVLSQQPEDSLIYAEGKIINAQTKELVAARVTYQSMPFGNKIGILHKNSTYSFPMYDGDRYTIIVEAPGYAPAKVMIDPAEANEAKRVVKDVELLVEIKEDHSVGHVMRLNNLIFELGKSKISPQSHPELDIVLNMMKHNHRMVIQLEGHTDYQGDPKQNMKLSQQRVDAVKAYLVSKGIHKARVKTKAYGGTAPLSREDTPEAHALNRRVELRILEN